MIFKLRPFNKIIYLFILLFISSQISYSQGIFISKLSDLSFGDVFIGYNAEVLHTDPGAAKFSFYHSNSKQKNVRINFNLPTTLTYGVDNIPIIFDLNHSTWSLNDQISGRTNFDPFSQLKIKKLDSFQTVYVWMGGQITTSAGLPPGLYQGTLVITVEY